MPEVSDLRITIGCDLSQLEAGLNRANQPVSGFDWGRGFATAGTAMAAGIAAGVMTARGLDLAVEEAAHIVCILAGAANAYPISVDEMGR